MFVEQNYCAKIILFGEYTVLFGGDALAIPFFKYAGKWVKNSEPDIRLLSFLPYLKEINEDLHFQLDLDKLSLYWNMGWKFNSTIPNGYGLGSSAALCASIYHTSWNSASILPTPWQSKEDLSRLESYFHGKSSGFDALVSLFQAPIFYREGNIELCTLPPKFLYRWSLWNTGISRSTEPLVNQFREKFNEPEFKHKMEVLTGLSNSVLRSFLLGKDHFTSLKEISHIQYDHLTFLIPPNCKSLWKKTLDHPDIAIKLCGAGGGGYLLVASKDESITPGFFNPVMLETIN